MTPISSKAAMGRPVRQARAWAHALYNGASDEARSPIQRCAVGPGTRGRVASAMLLEVVAMDGSREVPRSRSRTTAAAHGPVVVPRHRQAHSLRPTLHRHADQNVHGLSGAWGWIGVILLFLSLNPGLMPEVASCPGNAPLGGRGGGGIVGDTANSPGWSEAWQSFILNTTVDVIAVAHGARARARARTERTPHGTGI